MRQISFTVTYALTDTSGHSQTLDAFISEAGLEPDAGNIGKDDLTIEKILEEKKVFDLSVRFEKFGAEDGEAKWSVPGMFLSLSPTIHENTSVVE